MLWCGGADSLILNLLDDLRDIEQMLVRAKLRSLFEIDRHRNQRGKGTLDWSQYISPLLICYAKWCASRNRSPGEQSAFKT
jgi:hypothetical protein